MATKQIDIPEIGIVTLYKRRGNRSLRLSVDGLGGIRVSLPMWVPYKVGEQFVRSKAEWVKEKSKAHVRTQLQNRDKIGKTHTIYFERRPDNSGVTSRVDDSAIRIAFGRQYISSDQKVQDVAAKACIKALRKQAETLMPPRVQAIASRAGFSYRSVGVKQLKGRWGSCDTNRDILFNLYLMQLPWPLIDYVIMHELVHTQVMRHGPPFWHKMAEHLPQTQMLRAKMKEYKPILLPAGETVA